MWASELRGAEPWWFRLAKGGYKVVGPPCWLLQTQFWNAISFMKDAWTGTTGNGLQQGHHDSSFEGNHNHLKSYVSPLVQDIRYTISHCIETYSAKTHDVDPNKNSYQWLSGYMSRVLNWRCWSYGIQEAGAWPGVRRNMPSHSWVSAITWPWS